MEWWKRISFFYSFHRESQISAVRFSELLGKPRTKRSWYFV